MKIYSINTSEAKGKAKTPVPEALLKLNYGIDGDAHGGLETCQISLLAYESIEKSNRLIKEKGKDFVLSCGDFAENLTTKGLDLSFLRIGDQLHLEGGPILEISQIGKTCHGKCSVYYRTGDCIMPRECVFAIVKEGGKITPGIKITVVLKDEKHGEKNEGLYINH